MFLPLSEIFPLSRWNSSTLPPFSTFSNFSTPPLKRGDETMRQQRVFGTTFLTTYIRYPPEWTAPFFDIFWHYLTKFRNIQHCLTMHSIIRQYFAFFCTIWKFFNSKHYSTTFNIVFYINWQSNSVEKCCGPRFLLTNYAADVKKYAAHSGGIKYMTFSA